MTPVEGEGYPGNIPKAKTDSDSVDSQSLATACFGGMKTVGK